MQGEMEKPSARRTHNSWLLVRKISRDPWVLPSKIYFTITFKNGLCSGVISSRTSARLNSTKSSWDFSVLKLRTGKRFSSEDW